MANRSRRVQPTRISKRTASYSESPIDDDDGEDDQRLRSLPRIVPFQNIEEAVKGGLAKPACDIPKGACCRIVGRVTAHPDFFVVADRTSQFAVKLEDILSHVPREHLEWYENSVYLYQEDLATGFSATSSLRSRTPENALSKYTQAIWVLPAVCSTCYNGPARAVPAPERPPSVPTFDTPAAQETTEQDRGQVETNESESSDDDWLRPQKKRTIEEYIRRIQELEQRCNKAEDRAFARSNKGLENDRRRIRSLERTVEGLQEDIKVYRVQNSRHQRRMTELEAQIRALKSVSSELKCSEADPDETEDESYELRQELMRGLKNRKLHGPR